MPRSSSSIFPKMRRTRTAKQTIRTIDMNILRNRRDELADSGISASRAAQARNPVKQAIKPPSAGHQERRALHERRNASAAKAANCSACCVHSEMMWQSAASGNTVITVDGRRNQPEKAGELNQADAGVTSDAR